MNKNSARFFFEEPISLFQGDYYFGVAQFSVWNTVFNITTDNNNLKYSTDDGDTWKDINIPPGTYQIGEINNVIQTILEKNTDVFFPSNDESPIELYPNTATQKSIIQLKTGPSIATRFQVDLTQANSIAHLLGFNPKILKSELNMSDNKVNIISIDKIHLHCDIVRGSILNGQNSSILYSFYLDKPPGYQLFNRENIVLYKNVIKDKIESIHFEFKDDDGNPVSFQGETITFTCVLMEK